MTNTTQKKGISLTQIVMKMLYSEIMTNAPKHITNSFKHLIFKATIKEVDNKIEVVVNDTFITNEENQRESFTLQGGKDKMLQNMPEQFKRAIFDAIQEQGSPEIVNNLDFILMYTSLDKNGNMKVIDNQLISKTGQSEFINIEFNKN